MVWLFGVVALVGVESRATGGLYGGITPVTSAVLFGMFPLAMVYQAAFILRYPGIAARHNIQPPRRYRGPTEYSTEAAPKFAVAALLYGVAFVVIPAVAFGGWPPT